MLAFVGRGVAEMKNTIFQYSLPAGWDIVLNCYYHS